MLRHVIAIDLGGTNFRVGIVNSRGQLSHLEKKPTPREGKKAILEGLASEIQNVLAVAKKRKWPISGIAIGCPGPVSSSHGVVYHAPNLPGWKNVPVKKFFQNRFKMPVLVENDANAAALGETWVGAGHGAKSSVCLTLGTGVGGGIVIQGKIWHGMDDIAGEIGHMVVREDGEFCKCGNRGCLELYTSATGVVRRMKQALKKAGKTNLNGDPDLTSKKIFAAARKGNRLARTVALETGRILGVALTTLIHILNPQVIIIGGGVAENWDQIRRPLHKEVRWRTFPQATRHLKIVPAKLGDHAGMIGAAHAFFLAHP